MISEGGSDFTSETIISIPNSSDLELKGNKLIWNSSFKDLKLSFSSAFELNGKWSAIFLNNIDNILPDKNDHHHYQGLRPTRNTP